jgi:hypothetical protein
MSKVMTKLKLDAYAPVAFNLTCPCKWLEEHYEVAGVYACERFLQLYHEKGMG